MSFDAKTDRRLNLPQGVIGSGKTAQIFDAVVALRPKPDANVGIDTQLYIGAVVTVYKEENGWALVQALADGYVGYLRAEILSYDEPLPTHHVIVPRTFMYVGQDMKVPIAFPASLGSRIYVKSVFETRGTKYAALRDGFSMIANHLAPIDQHLTDPVTVAETLIHTPYLWGGVSAFGIDCSGLVQLCFAMCGIQVLRDTDMQAATIGTPISKNQLQRGDLIFWKGHVAFYRGDGTIIHANGHTMSVAIEGLDDAIARIGYLYGDPTDYISTRA